MELWPHLNAGVPEEELGQEALPGVWEAQTVVLHQRTPSLRVSGGAAGHVQHLCHGMAPHRWGGGVDKDKGQGHALREGSYMSQVEQCYGFTSTSSIYPQ